VRLGARRGAKGSSREERGCVTGLASRDGERGKSTLPCVLGNTHFDAAAFSVAIATEKAAARPRGLFPARKAPECARRLREVWSSRRLPHGSVSGAASLARTLDVSPTSARTRAERRTPSRPGRLIAVTASQDRDETPRTDLGLPPRPGQRRDSPLPSPSHRMGVKPATHFLQPSKHGSPARPYRPGQASRV